MLAVSVCSCSGSVVVQPCLLHLFGTCCYEYLVFQHKRLERLCCLHISLDEQCLQQGKLCLI